MKRSIVVIPTYNEAENIPVLVTTICSLGPGYEVLVVDDSSPDGTAACVEKLRRDRPELASRISLRVRPGKGGLGSAYREGLTEALTRNPDAVFQMDADFSHDPQDLPRLLERLEEADLVLGSRYIPGGGTVGWPWKRELLSRVANLYARFLLWVPVHDLTGGFKCFRKEALRAADLSHLTSEGYTFQIETTARLLRKGYRVAEVPILFRERTRGKSKISSWRVILQTVWLVLRLRFSQ
ncbi:MAG: polyprenol monophosphomannose synthase [Pseudomonadota bacterium]